MALVKNFSICLEVTTPHLKWSNTSLTTKGYVLNSSVPQTKKKSNNYKALDRKLVQSSNNQDYSRVTLGSFPLSSQAVLRINLHKVASRIVNCSIAFITLLIRAATVHEVLWTPTLASVLRRSIWKVINRISFVWSLSTIKSPLQKSWIKAR